MGFYIAKLTVLGDKKTPSVVNFTNGLNIICGVSDAGKTYILKCIKFAFGGDKPFETKVTGYSTIKLLLITDKEKKVEITRIIGEKTAKVRSESPSIRSGAYDINPNSSQKGKRNRNPLLNELFLSLIGIDGEPEVVFNKYFVRKRFTWKTILQLFYLTEKDVIEQESPLMPKQHINRVYMHSSLLYLLTGNNYADEKTRETEKVAKIRKNAVDLFAKDELNRLREQETRLQETLKNCSNINLERELQIKRDKLIELEKKISVAREKCKKISETIATAQREIYEKKVLLESLKNLESQYKADIKRLNFIVEGIQKSNGSQKEQECPICKTRIVNSLDEDYLDSARAELMRIISLLKGLLATENDVDNEIVEINNFITDKKVDLSKEQQFIQTAYSEYARKREANINEILNFIKCKEQLAWLQENIGALSKTLKEYATKIDDNDTELEFHPYKLYPDEFEKNMDAYAMEVLKECNYEGLQSVRFDKKSLDLWINGYEKKHTHGKGHWAFINTCLMLVLRKYFETKAVYNPGLLLIDTPLLGLDQGEPDDMPSSMKNGLFKYLINHRNEGQVIVIENSNALPKLNYNLANISVLEFTKGKYESEYTSRYGLLDI